MGMEMGETLGQEWGESASVGGVKRAWRYKEIEGKLAAGPHFRARLNVQTKPTHSPNAGRVEVCVRLFIVASCLPQWDNKCP